MKEEKNPQLEQESNTMAADERKKKENKSVKDRAIVD